MTMATNQVMAFMLHLLNNGSSLGVKMERSLSGNDMGAYGKLGIISTRALQKRFLIVSSTLTMPSRTGYHINLQAFSYTRQGNVSMYVA